MSFSRTRVRSLAALFALAGLLPGVGLASAAAARIERPVTDAPAAPAAAAPAPTAPQRARALLIEAMRETAPGVYEGIMPFRLPDGSWQVDLDERFHAFSVMRLGAGGRRAGTCVLGAAGLAQWQGSHTPACAHDHGAASPAVRPTVSGPTSTVTTTWEAR